MRAQLAVAGVDAAEADGLLMHALGVSRAWLLIHDHEPLGEAQRQWLANAVTQRCDGEPFAYIVGEQGFYGRLFVVTPDVLIPRSDTECLIDAALARFAAGYWLDLGTGSGAIAITLALQRPDWSWLASDRSAAALRIAQRNARALSAPVAFWRGDWLAAVAPRSVAGIVANPPYLAPDDPHLPALAREPTTALVAAQAGLADLRAIADAALRALKPGGWLLMEHGHRQGAAARELLAGYADVQTLLDIEQRERVTLGRKRC